MASTAMLMRYVQVQYRCNTGVIQVQYRCNTGVTAPHTLMLMFFVLWVVTLLLMSIVVQKFFDKINVC